FGGQVIGQALNAATATVPKQYFVHSLHSYFILPGDNSLPILYEVQRVRNGKSYCTRTVMAKQKGRCILSLNCSFALLESGQPLRHQCPMPKCPDPETLPT
ncbi:5176_t:CDS:2, partial [Paraglomus brasilianum]